MHLHQTMAASIKMDELLVQWLGSDTVYENVLNLVETLRKEETAANDENNLNNDHSNTLDSPPNSPRRTSDRSSQEYKFNYEDSNNELSSSAADGGNKKVNIPPFYRPPGTYLNGMKMKSIRRSRSNSFDSDQSWDGIYSVDSTASSSNSDPAASTPDNNNNNNNNNAEDANTSSNNAANTIATKSDVPIKEQVLQIFERHGKSLTNNTQNRSHLLNQSQYQQSKYLTLDNFVKITKDICNFPTFFNKPLYKRILYLWNTQDVKSDSGKLLLWNEYYQSTEELDIGIDPNEENEDNNDDGKNEGKKESNEEKKKKRKSNELLDQLDKFITYDIFKWYWTQEMEDFDLSDRFYRLLKKPHEDHVSKDDFGPFIKELLNDHPVSFEFFSLVLS